MIKEKNILTILTLACIVVAAWIILSIYHNAKTSTIDDALQVQIQPITPSFDTSVIDELGQRQVVSPQFGVVQNVVISPTPASPIPSTIPVTQPPILPTTKPSETPQPTGSSP